MNRIALGQTDIKVSRIGLGCMGMSFAYGDIDRDACVQTLETALGAGVNFWDTSDFYGLGHNEQFLGEVLRGRRNSVVLATKCGIVAQNGDPRNQSRNTTPAHIKSACDASLKRLGTNVIDLYYLHRLDGVTALEDSIGALSELHAAGKIRSIGLSEVSSGTIKKAHALFPVSAVQNEYSLLTRDIDIEAAIDTCLEIGATFVPYSPVSRGLLTNELRVGAFGSRDFRSILPRFQSGALEKNNQLISKLNELAKAKAATLVQLALAWVLARGPHVVPIPGTRKPDRLRENAAAAEIQLTQSELRQIEETIPVSEIHGARYPAASHRGLD